MKTNNNNSVAINNTDKTNKDIRNNSLFADLTAQEEVFVRGGAPRIAGAQ